MILTLAVVLIVDIYIFFGLKSSIKAFNSNICSFAYMATSLFTIAGVVVAVVGISETDGLTSLTLYKNLLFGIGFAFLIAKLFAGVPLLIEDIYRVGRWIVSSLSEMTFAGFVPRISYVGYFVSAVGSFIALIMIHGVIFGKYNFQKMETEIEFDTLPTAFNGFTIVQISDAHLGTFDDVSRVQKGIDLIQAQNPDIIVFTGDLVNDLAVEAKPYIEMFKNLKAPYGKYSILGNHDYSDYVQWESQSGKVQNLEDLKDTYKQMGFELLLNRSVLLEKADTSIRLIGVENWGAPPFPKYGDLGEAVLDIDPNEFSVLLTHDPTHWDGEVLNLDNNIALTLSGHTHGMQFGIKIGNWQWSPIQWKYKKWGGLYEEAGKYLYINRGFGSLGFPGRVGIWPEVTVLKLKATK